MIIFDNMIPDMLSNKNLESRKVNIALVLIE